MPGDPTRSQDAAHAHVASTTSSHSVRQVKFLDPVSAVVQFGIVNADGHSIIVDQLGHAIHDRGRWKIRRNTFASLAFLANVNVPKPAK